MTVNPQVRTIILSLKGNYVFFLTWSLFFYVFVSRCLMGPIFGIGPVISEIAAVDSSETSYS